MRHCIPQWLLQWACWVQYQGSLTALYKLSSSYEYVRHQWCVVKKLGQILVRSWNSHPYPMDLSAPWWCEALHCPMIVSLGAGWVHDQGLTTLHKLGRYTLGTCQTSMICGQKVRPDFGQILKNSCPESSRYQCTMMVWGTAFTNDCCSRLDGSITKVWQPFTGNIHTGNMSDINDVWSKS